MSSLIFFRPAVVLSAITIVAGLSLTIVEAQEAVTIAELAKRTHFHGLAVDPSDPSRLYLATHHGFFLVSVDGRARRLSEKDDDFMGFAPHPRDASVLYASGHPAGGGNLGVIVSRDGGRTWRPLAKGVGGPVDFHQMAVSKVDPNVIFGVHSGLQASRDGGRSWTKVGSAPEGLIALAASSQDVNTMFAATQTGLLRSTDGGRSWQPAHLLRRPATMVATTGTGNVYAFLAGIGLVSTAEASLGWRVINNNFGDRYILHFGIAPEADERLYAVTDRQEILASRDGGATWTPFGSSSGPMR